MQKTTRMLIVTGMAVTFSGILVLSEQVRGATQRPRPPASSSQAGGGRPVQRVQVGLPPDAPFVPDLSGAHVPLATNGVHPVVGSWFGKAIELCPQGVSTSACAFGLPAASLYMTPTLAADGTFLGNDTFSLQGPPFGPHTTAHGSWVGTGTTTFNADYVFMVWSFPPVSDEFSAVRFQWRGQVVDADTAVGFVNAWFIKGVPLGWTRLGANEYPSLAPEAISALKPPTAFIFDPTTCPRDPCPLVFKFTIKRVSE